MSADQVTASLLLQLPTLAAVADVPAEKVITELVDEHFHARAKPEALKGVLPELMQMIADTRQPEPTVEEFVRGGEEIDAIIDPNRERIQHAQEFFDDNGVAIIAALFHASLPEAYLGKRGVQALDITGELSRNWTRRVQETGMFLLNVLSPTPDLWQHKKRTSLSSGEFGARAARRVRLIHAAIRWMLGDVESPGASLVGDVRAGPTTIWRGRMIDIGLEDKPSAPLNQEDLLGTLGTFTTVVLGALEKFGVAVTAEDRDAYHFLWNVVGWHLGIGNTATLGPAGVGSPGASWPSNALLQLSADQMDAVYGDIAKRQQHESDQGRRMTKALLQELAYPLPRALQGFPAFLTRYLIDDGKTHKADQLGIEAGGYAELMLGRAGLLNRWARDARGRPGGRMTIQLVTELVTRYALRAFVAQARWSERGLKIDKRIAAKWGVQIPPDPASMETAPS
jgi:hypothetical protein